MDSYYFGLAAHLILPQAKVDRQSEWDFQNQCQANPDQKSDDSACIHDQLIDSIVHVTPVELDCEFTVDRLVYLLMVVRSVVEGCLPVVVMVVDDDHLRGAVRPLVVVLRMRVVELLNGN